MAKLRTSTYRTTSVVKEAKKRLVVSVSSVQPTAELERKAAELAAIADRASKARFLEKYRRVLAA